MRKIDFSALEYMLVKTKEDSIKAGEQLAYIDRHYKTDKGPFSHSEFFALVHTAMELQKINIKLLEVFSESLKALKENNGH